jgi:hypothetical protein
MMDTAAALPATPGAAPVTDATYCEGCDADGRPLTSAGFCPICAEIAVAQGDGDRVGLPEPADVDVAIEALDTHIGECAFLDDGDPDQCPVCAFASITCPECLLESDVIEVEGIDPHEYSDEWVIVGCEGFVMPILRAAMVWADREHPA